MKELEMRHILDKYLLRTKQHSMLTNYRLNSIYEYLDMLWNDYLRKNREIHKSCLDNLGKSVSLPPTQEEIDSLTSDEKLIVEEALRKLELNYIGFIVAISGLINSAFFALESECKIFCSLGCIAFSIRYAQDEIIQHKDVWLTLKRLGKVIQTRSVNCEICKLQENCFFSINFEALANVYCYAIKVRMLSDYEEFFYKIQTWEKIKVYFDKLKDVITKQIMIKHKCLEEKLWQPH
jgi:hypothetical protein